MIKVRQKYNSNVVYFKFFASNLYPACFWYTITTENLGFELGRIDDYIPLYKTWKEIRNEE